MKIVNESIKVRLSGGGLYISKQFLFFNEFFQLFKHCTWTHWKHKVEISPTVVYNYLKLSISQLNYS